MKKSILSMTLLASIFFVSCGGGADMDADAKSICDCMKDTEHKTPEECKEMFDKMKENYSKEDAKKLWEKGTLECQ